MPKYWENTLEHRKPRLEIPEDYEEVEGSRQLSRKFEAQAQVEYAKFERKIREVSPGSLIVGVETRQIVTKDPGALTFYTMDRPGLTAERTSIGFSLTFDDGSFQGAKGRELDSVSEVLGALDAAKDEGFTVEEIATAFGAGEPLQVIRQKVVKAIVAHVGSIRGRAKVKYLEDAAELEALLGFTDEDLGPIASEIFEEELEKTVGESDLPAVLDLVEKLTA